MQYLSHNYVHHRKNVYVLRNVSPGLTITISHADIPDHDRVDGEVRTPHSRRQRRAPLVKSCPRAHLDRTVPALTLLCPAWAPSGGLGHVCASVSGVFACGCACVVYVSPLERQVLLSGNRGGMLARTSSDGLTPTLQESHPHRTMHATNHTLRLGSVQLELHDGPCAD